MTFRLVESSKKERILEFFSLIDEEFIPPLSCRVNLNDYANKLADTANNFFLVYGSADVAHVAFYCNDFRFKTAFISSIGVSPEFQGSGAAGYLLQKVIERCANERMDTLRLEVDCENVKAVNFYKSKGFRFISRNLMQKKIKNG